MECVTQLRHIYLRPTRPYVLSQSVVWSNAWRHGDCTTHIYEDGENIQENPFTKLAFRAVWLPALKCANYVHMTHFHEPTCPI